MKGFKPLGTAALVAVSLMASSNVAQAQITFSGYTQGCFYVTPVPPAVASSPACAGTASPTSYLGLTYSSATFTNVPSNAADGLFSLGDVPGQPNLGTFTLNGGGVDYTGESFALFLTFTAPPGSSSGEYNAAVTGNLIGNPAGGSVTVDFDNSPRTFTFADGTTLTFAVADVSLNSSGAPTYTATVPVTGHGYVTPEPASVTLLATGLVGIFGAARRRRKNIA